MARCAHEAERRHGGDDEQDAASGGRGQGAAGTGESTRGARGPRLQRSRADRRAEARDGQRQPAGGRRDDDGSDGTGEA